MAKVSQKFQESFKDKPLLSFQTDGEPMEGEINEGTAHVTFNDLKRNILCLGATGSGKTVGVMKPALQKLIETQNTAGLVIDVKGELCEMIDSCYGLDHDRFYWIGPHSRAESLNLLSNMSAQDFSDYLRSVTNLDLKSDNQIFAKKGMDTVRFIFKVFEIINDRKPTLREILEAYKKPQEFAASIRQDLQEQETLEPKYEYLIEEMQSIEEGDHEFHFLKKADYFSIDREDSFEKQFGFAQQNVVPYLKDFIEDDRLEKTICGEQSPDLRDIIFNQEKIIVMDLPAVKNEPTIRAQKLIRSKFHDAVLQEKGSSDQPFADSHMRTFEVIDDYQQIVSFDGHLDDNHWLDICRGLDHGVLAGTQSINSLWGEIGTNNISRVKTLQQNFRTQIYLESSDKLTIDQAEFLVGGSKSEIPMDLGDSQERPIGLLNDKDLDCDESDEQVGVRERLMHPDKKGQAFLYQGCSEKQDSGSFMGYIQTGPVPGHPHMGNFINRDLERKHEMNDNTKAGQSYDDDLIDNPYSSEKFEAMMENSNTQRKRGATRRRNRSHQKRSERSDDTPQSGGISDSSGTDESSSKSSSTARKSANKQWEQKSLGEKCERVGELFTHFLIQAVGGRPIKDGTERWIKSTVATLGDQGIHPEDLKGLKQHLEKQVEPNENPG